MYVCSMYHRIIMCGTLSSDEAMYDLGVFSENLAVSYKPWDQVREEPSSHSAEWESII
jgi:hypothetical protein